MIVGAIPLIYCKKIQLPGESSMLRIKIPDTWADENEMAIIYVIVNQSKKSMQIGSIKLKALGNYVKDMETTSQTIDWCNTVKLNVCADG